MNISQVSFHHPVDSSDSYHPSHIFVIMGIYSGFESSLLARMLVIAFAKEGLMFSLVSPSTSGY
jgi:hypothetical protein